MATLFELRFTVGSRPDTVAPETTITGGPSGTIPSQFIIVSFTSSEPGSGFECRWSGSGNWGPCSSPAEPGCCQLDGPHTFEVRAIDGSGNVDASPATRSYLIQDDAPEPPNDSFWDPIALTGGSGTVSGTNEGADDSVFDDETVNGMFGSNSVWYEWQAPADGPVTFETSGSDFDTMLAAYTGDPAVQIAQNDDASASTRTSRIHFQATKGTRYKLMIEGFCDDQLFAERGHFLLKWSLAGPTDTGPPNVAFSAPVGGARVGGSVVLAANASDDVSVARVEFSAAGSPVGTASAPPYQVTWNAAGIPDEAVVELKATAIDGAGRSTSASRFVIVDNTPPETIIGTGPAGTEWFSGATFYFEANEAGATFECSLDGSEWTTFKCNSPREYGGQTEGPHTLRVRAVDVSNNVDPTPATRSWVVRTAAPAGVPNDAFADGTGLYFPSGRVSDTDAGATLEPGEPDHGGNNVGASIWFRWPAPKTGTATFNTIGSLFDTVLAVYTGNDLASLTRIAANDDYTGGSKASRVSFSAQAGTVYHVVVAGNRGSTGYYGLAWSQGAEDDPPETTILSGPSGSVAGGSATVTFESSESGSTFQCALNGGPWHACASPISYAGLHEGAYTFYVRATDASANVDPSPATRAWAVP